MDSGAVGDFPESEDLTHEQVSLFPDDVFNVMRIRREGGNSRQRQGREDAVGSKPLGLETDVDAEEAAHVRQANLLLRVRTDRVAFVVQEDESARESDKERKGRGT